MINTDEILNILYFSMVAFFSYFIIKGWYLYYVRRKIPKSKFYLLFYYSLFPILCILVTIFIGAYFGGENLPNKWILQESYLLYIAFVIILIGMTYTSYKKEREYEEKKKELGGILK